MTAVATSAELLTKMPEPEPPPWVLTVRPLAVSRNGTETLASDFVKGPPPPAGSVTEGDGGELIVRPNELAATCSPKAPPTSARTLLLTVDVLLARLGSGSLAFTPAALEMVPLAVGVTLIVTVAPAPAARLPREQVTVPEDWLHEPWLALAETKLTP